MDETSSKAFADKFYHVLKSQDGSGKGIVNFYSQEAKKYDDVVSSKGSIGPSVVADKMAELVPVSERSKDFVILDVGAGTGRIGEELKKRGFQTFHGLEPSKEMLDLLIAKNIYQKTFCQFFGGGTPFDVKDGSYDAVAISGCFVKGHLPVDALREIARVLKPGGFFVTKNTQYLDEGSRDYDAAVEAEMKKMEEEQVWTAISREEVRCKTEYLASRVQTLLAFRRN